MSQITLTPNSSLPEPTPQDSAWHARNLRKPQPRIWPGGVLILLQVAAGALPDFLDVGPFGKFLSMFYGPMIVAVGLALWWLFASRVRWTDRLLIPLAFTATAVGVYYLCDPSMKPNGFPMGLLIYGLPVVSSVGVLWLLVTPGLNWPVRSAGLVAAFLLAGGYVSVLRLDGLDGYIVGEKSFRWTLTAEQKFLAQAPAKQSDAPATPSAEKLTLRPGDWSGFRGPDRDGKLPGVRIAADWKGAPPSLVWRHRVGPAWSSMVVVGDRLYTQEQRGEDEAVVCYDAKTGDQLWAHTDAARFSDVVSGAGPRGTPTFHDGRIFAFGATGRLNCLDAVTGSPIWTVDAAKDAGSKPPMWGYAASPLAAAGVVAVFLGGPGDKPTDPAGKNVVAYDAKTGKLAWTAGEGELSYASLQPARLCGVDQWLMATGEGLTALNPADGRVLWKHDWAMDKNMARIVQPTVVGDSDVVLGTFFGFGTRRIHLTHSGAAWTPDEVWTTKAMKPYYNDSVVHKGHLYGFDDAMLVCVNLENGKVLWSERGYDHGQMLLLPDQDLLVVLTEKGAAAVVKADPAKRQELGRFQAITGKTWNHPVIAHGKLFVRNGEEMACYQLTTPDGAFAPAMIGD